MFRESKSGVSKSGNFFWGFVIVSAILLVRHLLLNYNNSMCMDYNYSSYLITIHRNLSVLAILCPQAGPGRGPR